jgi:hypothetical protein
MRGIMNSCKFLILIAVLSQLVASSLIMSAWSSPETVYTVEPEGVTARLGETFTVDVKIYDAFYLYSWQVTMYWDDTVLNFAGYVFGGFLEDQPEGSSTNERIESNFFIIGEATMGEYMGKTADEGLLLTITFAVVGTGDCTLDINNIYTLYYECFTPPTTTKITDFPKNNGHYWPPWAEDINADGTIDIFDICSIGIDWGRCTPGIGLTEPEHTPEMMLVTSTLPRRTMSMTIPCMDSRPLHGMACRR